MKGRERGPAAGEMLSAEFRGQDARNLVGLNGIKSLVLLSIEGNEYCDRDYLGATILSTLRSTAAKEPPKISQTELSEDKRPVEPATENFTTFLVADEVYWHNLKTIDIDNEEEARPRALYESREKEYEEEKNESSPSSYSEFSNLTTEARAISADSNLRKPALATQLAEEIRLKDKAISLGNAYLERNLEQFLRPFGLNMEEFNTLYNFILDDTNRETEPRILDLTHEQIINLELAVRNAETPIDKKIALINQLAIEKQKNFVILRWKDWVNCDQFFKENQHQLMECYSQVPSLQISITKTAKEFATRHKDKGGSYDEWYFRSQGYLTEESPAVMWLGAKHKINRIIYPGEMLDCFKATKELFIKELFIVDATNPEKSCPGKLPFEIYAEEPKLLVNWIACRFKREYSPEQKADMQKAAMAKSTQDKSPAVVVSPKKQGGTSSSVNQALAANSTRLNNHGLFAAEAASSKRKGLESLRDRESKNQKSDDQHSLPLEELVKKAVEIYQTKTKSEERHLKRDEEKQVAESVKSALEVVLSLDETEFSILRTAMAVLDEQQRKKVVEDYSILSTKGSHPT
ncbi:hypothetical protein Lnau_1743 [Legionella nautarum]|uniref:Uncharacterized protein n=1 Tax=Legionella nautarum TaxID=45070 RepID=A0A0W0WWQ5_9GAMM|nr:hypothetical protein [Legionella nautarum]KTD36759.1 hypothetical protein Lnau_1743 [Legionella nautarum]